MASSDHDQAFHLAADHVNNGRLTEALAIFAQLTETDLDDFGKAMACVNAAVVSDKLDRVDEALRWYDRGIRFERSVDRYVVALRKADYCVEKERHAEALASVQALVASGVSDLDKANACLQAAGVAEKLGRSDDALAWYDRGMSYERQHSRFFVAEHKAAYLAGKGRAQESAALYTRIASESSLTEADKDRIRNNLAVVKGDAR
jgi:tetratricopeptide (TPR) repeat protein